MSTGNFQQLEVVAVARHNLAQVVENVTNLTYTNDIDYNHYTWLSAFL